jgi:hypothetical protein
MASITPATRCGRCGKLFGEHPRHADGKLGRWECGHVIDGDNRGPLRIEHSLCNRKAGGALGYARSIGRDRGARTEPRPVGPHHPSHYDLDNPRALTAAPCLAYTGALCQTCAEWRARNSKPKG